MIAFDCWGTLFGNSQHPHPFAVFASKLGQDINDRSFLELFEHELMTGEFSDFRTSISRLVRKLKIEVSATLLLELETDLKDSVDTQVVFPETLRVLDELRRNYRLAMITNTFPQGFEMLCRNYGIKQDFDFVLTSFEERAVKPSPVMFHALLERSGLSPSEILYVGDSVESDIKPADKLGMSTVLIDRRDRYPEFKGRIRDLRELKLHLAK